MKMPHVGSAFVPAVLLGESEPKGVAEASQKAAEQVVSMHPLCLLTLYPDMVHNLVRFTSLVSWC